jgi:hypothetical protein
VTNGSNPHLEVDGLLLGEQLPQDGVVGHLDVAQVVGEEPAGVEFLR